ncbi:MAG: cytochrome c3 family protein [Planctomycetota bacterium]|jgi:hypothetical protein
MRAINFFLFLMLPALVLACGGNGAVTKAPATVTVQGQSEVAVGGQTPFTATTDNGSDAGYTWMSSNNAVAMVDANGMVTGIGKGEATISAEGLNSGATGGYLVKVNFDPSEDVPFYDDWAGSGHADTTAEAFTHWDDDGSISASCAKCHSRFGFHDFLGEDGSTPGQVDSEAALGSVVDCVTCHNESSMALTEVTFPSGVTVPAPGREATCMNCHQGRSSSDTVDAAIEAIGPANDDEILPDRGFINVHYFPAAATRYGGQVRGGYLYEGQAYDVRFRHVEGAHDCQECHNPHTLELRYDECQKCHEGVEQVSDLWQIRMMSSATRDYDGDGNLNEGLYYEVDGLRTILYAAIQRYSADVIGMPIVYDSHSYPYWFNDTNGNGTSDAGEASYGNRYTSFTSRTLKATYNFQYATKDPGGFAHNGKFIIQIVHDSIMDLNDGLDDNGEAVVPFTGVRDDMGHFDGTAEAFRHWDDDGEVSASCAKCHAASEGFEEFVTFGKNTSHEIANGFDCAVCHTTFDTFEVRFVESVTFPSGYETPSLDAGDPAPIVQSNICMTCHQGRTSGPQIDAVIDSGNLRFQNIHYLAAGATLMGNLAQGGYEYDGKTYAGKFQHSTTANNNNCVDCHNVFTTTHTFVPENNIAYCRQCHAGITDLHEIRPSTSRAADYNGNGKDGSGSFGDADWESLSDELTGLAAALLTQMQVVARAAGNPICYDAHGYPYFFNDLNDNGIADENEIGYGNRYQAWTPGLLRASHNYQHSQKEPGAWAHNFSYIVQLVFDSIDDLGGDVTNFVRP